MLLKVTFQVQSFIEQFRIREEFEGVKYDIRDLKFEIDFKNRSETRVDQTIRRRRRQRGHEPEISIEVTGNPAVQRDLGGFKQLNLCLDIHHEHDLDLSPPLRLLAIFYERLAVKHLGRLPPVPTRQRK